MSASPFIYPKQRVKAIENYIYSHKEDFIKKFINKDNVVIDLIGFGSSNIIIYFTDLDRLWQIHTTISVKEFIEWRDS